MMTVKDERLQIRVDPTDKSLLERAAEASHVNVSAFVLQAAAARAEEILAERRTIRLEGGVAEAFEKALSHPAYVNERLSEALSRPRGFSWID